MSSSRIKSCFRLTLNGLKNPHTSTFFIFFFQLLFPAISVPGFRSFYSHLRVIGLLALHSKWHCSSIQLVHSIYRHVFCLGLCRLLHKSKAVPLQAWSGPERSRKLTFPDFMTTAQGGGKVVSLTHRPHLPPGNTPGTHFC